MTLGVGVEGVMLVVERHIRAQLRQSSMYSVVMSHQDKTHFWLIPFLASIVFCKTLKVQNFAINNVSGHSSSVSCFNDTYIFVLVNGKLNFLPAVLCVATGGNRCAAILPVRYPALITSILCSYIHINCSGQKKKQITLY